MFRLTREEADILLASRSQSVILKRGKNIKYLPYAFTEQGVAMLSSVLRSERAVQVNVAIMRALVSLRRMLATNDALCRKLAELERRLEKHDQGIKTLFDAIRELITPPARHDGKSASMPLAKTLQTAASRRQNGNETLKARTGCAKA